MSFDLISIFSSYITSLISSLSILGVAYLIIWVLLAKPLKKRRIQLSKRAGGRQIFREIKNTAIAFLFTSLFTSVIFWLNDTGLVDIYEEFGRFGLWYELLAGVILLCMSDTSFYWIHRLLHNPKLYKYVHAIHHESLDVTPFTSYSFHFLEAILNTLFFIPVILVMPISVTALAVVQVLGTLNNLKSHLGYELYPKFFQKNPVLHMLITSTHHNLHHSQYNGNYGLFFNFWDRVCGTELKDTDRVFVQIQDRQSVEIINNTTYRPLQITAIKRETVDTTSIYFEPKDKDFYNYSSGQYLNIKVVVNGQTHLRSFSLSSSPTEDTFLRITAKLNGEVTHYFQNQAQVGDTIESLLPVGDFIIEPKQETSKNYLFVAGGSGITPLFSMIKTILHQEHLSKVTLLYANKSKESIIFLDELAALQESFPDTLAVKHFISGQCRLSQADITKVVKDNTDIQTYICGPERLKKSVQEYVSNADVVKDDIYNEEFADGFVNVLKPSFWFGE